MRSQVSLYRLLILAFFLLAVTACSPLGWFIVSSTPNQPPTPEISTVAAPTAALATALAPTPTSAATPTRALVATPAPGSAAPGKTFASTKHHYTVSYPSNWTIDVQGGAAGGPGRDPENVFFHPPAGNLPLVTIYALKGTPPITGFENCNKNLIFRGLSACSLSFPKGQQPAQQLLIFQKGESFYQLAIQYEAQQQLAVFEDAERDRATFFA